MNSRTIGLLAISLLTLILHPTAFGQDKALQGAIDAAKAGKVTLLMRQKLLASQTLWEAMTTENYDVMKSSLSDLNRIAKEATWQTIDTEGFRGYSQSFQNAVTDMTAGLEEKSIKAVALPFVRLKLSCLECHELVRKPLKK